MTEGWEQKPLSEICGFQRGLTYAKSDEVDAPGHTVLRANNINLTSHELDFNELKFVSDSIVVPASKIVRPGSLLVCTASGSKTHLGKVAYIDSDYGHAFGGFMGQLTPSKGVDGRYLFYVLISPGYKDFIEALSDGVNINNLKFDDLGRFPVPLPPLPEQHRVVAILDEAFEATATAKANTDKSLQNAREVFETFTASIFQWGGASWQQGSLLSFAEAISTGPFGSLLHKSDYVSDGVPLVNPINIVDGLIVPDPSKLIDTATRQRLQSYILRAGDIIVGRRGEIGRCAVVGPNEDGWCSTLSIVSSPPDTAPWGSRTFRADWCAFA